MRSRWATRAFFSATQPDKSSLLAIAPGALFFDQQVRQPKTIQNSGNLTAGRDLTLAADNLELQGQLRSGGNLTLQAQNTLRIGDSVTAPFIASAGGNLLVQGDRSVDILTLNHPQSQIQSGGNLTLVSNGDISADAHFFSGGNLSMLTLAGTPGNFVSQFDPIIYANGNVLFGNYTGVALKVEATGNIQGGNIRITRAECAAGSAGCVGGISTSDPDFATLTSGKAVILRSGLPFVSAPNLPQNTGGASFTATSGLPSGIRVGSIDTSDSNGGNGGDIILTAAKGNITANSDFNSFSSSFYGSAGNGGAISLTATGGSITTQKLISASDVDLPFDFGNSGVGGTISLTAFGNITTGNLSSYSYSNSGNSAAGGVISLAATSGSISTGKLDSYSSSYFGDSSVGGLISLNASKGIVTGNLSSYSYSDSGKGGTGGAISLATTSGSISTSQLSSVSLSYGDSNLGGAISLTASGGNITTGNFYSYSSSDFGNSNLGGAISLTTSGGNIATGKLDSSSSSDIGNSDAGGAISLTTSGGNIATGKLDSSSLSPGSSNVGGAISLTATGGSITTGKLDSSSFSPLMNAGNVGDKGNGGAITLIASKDITTGDLSSASASSLYLSSGTAGNAGNTGNGGAITLVSSNNISTGNIKLILDSFLSLAIGNGRKWRKCGQWGGNYSYCGKQHYD